MMSRAELRRAGQVRGCWLGHGLGARTHCSGGHLVAALGWPAAACGGPHMPLLRLAGLSRCSGLEVACRAARRCADWRALPSAVEAARDGRTPTNVHTHCTTYEHIDLDEGRWG